MSKVRGLTFLLGIGEWDRRKVWVRFLLLLHWYKFVERETSYAEGFKNRTVANSMHWGSDKPETCRSFNPTTI